MPITQPDNHHTTGKLLAVCHKLPHGWLELLADALRCWQAAGRPDSHPHDNHAPEPGLASAAPPGPAEGWSRGDCDTLHTYLDGSNQAHAVTRANLAHALDLLARLITTNNLDHHRAERCRAVDDANDLLCALDANTPNSADRGGS